LTIDELTTTEPPEGPPPPPRRWSPRARWAAVLGGIVLVGLVTAGLLVKLPYYTLSPGSSRATEPLISVDGAPTYDAPGNVDFLTVSLREATPVELLAAWINPAVDVKSREDILGKQSPEENQKLNLQMMSDSKDAATYQALHRLGYDIPTSGSGAVVASVQQGSPADGTLKIGDVITSVNGQTVALNSDLVKVVGSQPPGTVLTMAVTTLDLPELQAAQAEGAEGVTSAEPGTTRTVEVTLGARADDPSRW
jgi:PDZ domain-containing protein